MRREKTLIEEQNKFVNFHPNEYAFDSWAVLGVKAGLEGQIARTALNWLDKPENIYYPVLIKLA